MSPQAGGRPVGSVDGRTGSASPLIAVREVWKRFGTLEVLRGVSLDVDAGEVVVVIGPSGSGKTTLLRALNALETVDGGTITIKGIHLAEPGSDGPTPVPGAWLLIAMPRTILLAPFGG